MNEESVADATNHLFENQQKINAELKMQKEKEELIGIGHGQYWTLTSEREFCEDAKKSKNMVLHCYRRLTMSCIKIDKHFFDLAEKHWETKFCRIDIEKAPVLCKHLKIKFTPTIILCINAKIIDIIVGFRELGETDDFPTELLEWRLGKSGIINYNRKFYSYTDIPAKRYPSIKCIEKYIGGGEKSEND